MNFPSRAVGGTLFSTHREPGVIHPILSETGLDDAVGVEAVLIAQITPLRLPTILLVDLDGSMLVKK
jgi:hypothetical protein